MKQPIAQRVKAYQMSNMVSRFHAHRLSHENTVGHHSANVALIAHELVEFNPQVEHEAYNILLWCLQHDLPEYFTGDIPAPVKWESNNVSMILDRMEKRWYASLDIQVPDLSHEAYTIFKASDALDAFITCYLEARAGNTLLGEVRAAYVAHIKTSFFHVNGVEEIFNEFQ